MSLDISNDSQVLVPVCEPVLTTGITVIKLKLEQAQVAQVEYISLGCCSFNLFVYQLHCWLRLGAWDIQVLPLLAASFSMEIATLAGKSSHVSNLLYIFIFILCSMSTFTVIVHGTLVSWGCHRSRLWEPLCMDLKAYCTKNSKP